VREEDGDGKASGWGMTEACVFLRTREPGLPIVGRWGNLDRELLEMIFFFRFPKKNKDGEGRLGTVGDA